MISNDLVAHFLNAKLPSTTTPSPAHSQLFLRERLFGLLRSKYSTTTAVSQNNESEQHLLAELYDFCRKENIINEVILHPTNDFFPLILRSREISALVSTTNPESYGHAIRHLSSQLEKTEEIFHLIDTSSSSPLTIFVSMLAVLKRSAGDLPIAINDYLRIHRESGHFVEPITSYIQSKILPEVKLNDQNVLRKLFKHFAGLGSSAELLLKQFIKEIKQNLGSRTDREKQMIFEKRNIWGPSIVYLLSQGLRDYVDSTLELVCLFILLLKFTQKAHCTVPDGLEVDIEIEMTLKDLAQTLAGLKLLSQAQINEHALDKLDSDDLKSYSYIDQLTCFCITEKSKYFPPEFEYSSKDVKHIDETNLIFFFTADI